MSSKIHQSLLRRPYFLDLPPEILDRKSVV